jgi:hypothetical protein
MGEQFLDLLATNVRSDLLLLDEPGKAVRRPVGAVSGQGSRLHAEARFGSLEHCQRRSDFRLSDGARRFDVDDHAVVGVDQVVICAQPSSPGPS